MVLTRLSHVGEVCPLGDHSYSDLPVPSSLTASISTGSSNKVVTFESKSCNTGTIETVEKDKKITENTSIFTFHILEFPNEILHCILGHISYKNLGPIRSVCQRFNGVASNILNSAFLKLQNQMLVRFQETKSQMPRRESARRKHPLARESDILEMLHMRLTLLQMTFGKHIDRKHCCFFAGEILDEVHRIMRAIKSTPTLGNLGKVFKITDELFDLSTMAMEYFKEFIEPILPVISYFHSDFLDYQNRFSESDEEPEPVPQSSMVLRKRIRKIRQGMRRYNSQLTTMKRELRGYKGRIGDQNKQMVEYATRMEEYDKKFDEASRKFNSVLQELNRCKTELQYYRSMSPVHNAIPLLCCCKNCPQSHAAATGFIIEDKSAGGPSLPAIQGVKNLQSLFDDDTSANCNSYDYNAPTHPYDYTPAKSVSYDYTPAKACDYSPTKKSYDYSAPSTSTSSSDLLAGHGDSLKMATPDDLSSKKRCSASSSDDDSDIDIDTVGRRVRERKRIKLY